ncbi:leucine-rich repeat-containing protein 15 [Diachasma alloeum]|uniref:leucine-rich repeat-containing protein 15 n=1 Tax=Diachasma alloeum TaxID=454923 RepID=UPI0007382E8B|nr:leucine-rich repeat-containing protein 15 [Diachasma alloeum]
MSSARVQRKILFFIFSLVISVKNVGTTDQVNCSRYFKGNRASISCANAGLDEFPENITELVQHLDLSGNNLKYIPEDIGRLVELKYLNLARNKLKGLPDQFGELWKLERLDLSQNDIHDVAGGIGVITRLPNLRILYLKENPISSLEDLANVAVRAVDASYCSIKNITNVSLLGLPELVSLNLAGNPLKTLQDIQNDKLKWLDLSSCRLNYLVPDTFKGLPALEHLKISNNPTLVYSTRKETLKHNVLKRLDASGCNLDRPGLHGLPSLTHVTLSRNVIRFLPDRIFGKNPAVIDLNLSGNGLARVNASSFVGMPRLEQLDLSGNNLETLPTVAFRDNVELNTLNLSYNDIRNFPRRLSTSVVNLDLSANLIEEVPRDSLTNMWRISGLDLSRNRLERFETGVESKTLTTLDLEGNRLTRLSNESFDNLPMLRKLDLSGNRLTEGFPWEIFTHNQELKKIHLHDNPWRCDCDQLLPTYLYLIQTPRKTNLLTLICHSPSNVSGYTWATACGKVWTQNPEDQLTNNKSFAIVMLGVLVAFFAFGSAVSIGHTVKTKRRQAELRVREAERAEARERLILHRRSRELEAELNRQEQHQPRINPAELLGPPTYEEAVEMPRIGRSLDTLNDISTEGLGHSQPSLSQNAWERKKRMQRKRPPKRARSENDLLSRRDERAKRPDRIIKNVRSTSSPRRSTSKSSISQSIITKKEDSRRQSESEDPASDANDTWKRTRSRPSINKKKKIVSMRRNGNSSDDEDSDRKSMLKVVKAAENDEKIRVMELPREPRSGTYRPPPSPSPVSSPEASDPSHVVSRSRLV